MPIKKDRVTRDNSKVWKQHQESQKGSYKDPRVYKIDMDENGKCSKTIRLLPSIDTDIAFVPTSYHYMQTPGGSVFRKDCPKNINKKCPICEKAWDGWKELSDDEKELRQPYRQQQRWLVNCVVIEDPEHPENNGKVFLFDFGPQFKNMIDELCNQGDFPWDWDTGRNLKIKGYMGKGKNGKPMPKFEKSDFEEKPSALELNIGNEDLIPLLPFVDESKFMSYEDLKEAFESAMGISSETRTARPSPRANAATVPSRRPEPDLPFDDESDDDDGDGFNIVEPNDSPDSFFADV